MLLKTFVDEYMKLELSDPTGIDTGILISPNYRLEIAKIEIPNLIIEIEYEENKKEASIHIGYKNKSGKTIHHFDFNIKNVLYDFYIGEPIKDPGGRSNVFDKYIKEDMSIGRLMVIKDKVLESDLQLDGISFICNDIRDALNPCLYLKLSDITSIDIQLFKPSTMKIINIEDKLTAYK